ncbi:IS1634 family transposase, partial [Sporolactobacillus shoreicorticis]|nr:IS1634 family transposase [Sporolactobacillus shoreicorticis]
MERLIFAMVANRALDPTSKLGLVDWIRDEVALPGLVCRAMDLLLEMRSQLEEQVYFATADLLNLEVDLIYFDTTSSYFEVESQEAPEEEQLRKLGYSKDKRPDLLQVVIGMAVTKEGLPIRCWVWPGNTADKTVVEEAKKDLVGWKLSRVISVMDRGFSTEDNLITLQRAGGHYIVGEPMRSGKKIVDDAMARKGRY